MEIRKCVKTECSTVVIGESLVHSTSCVASFIIVVVKCIAVESSGVTHPLL